MKSMHMMALILAGLLAVPAAYSQQAAAPAGSTGQCKDGSYTSQATKRGACKGHKGVQAWYAASAATAAKAAPASAPAAAPAAPPVVAAPVAPASNTANTGMRSRHAMPAPAANAAPGGGPGMVWVNDSSKVYHCPNDKWYGRTKHGQYMSKADAKAKGNHAEHGKSCAG